MLAKRIAVCGHSCVHPRQIYLLEELGRQGVEVLGVCPDTWADEKGEHIKEENFELKPLPLVAGYGFYTFHLAELEETITAFKPDLIYAMQEPFTLFAYDCLAVADKLNVPFCVFTWENKMNYRAGLGLDNVERFVINHTSLIICGNKGAKERMLSLGVFPHTLKLVPQTGVNSSIFRKIEAKKDVDVFFAGRYVREKGIRVLEEAVKDLDLKLLWAGGRGSCVPRIGENLGWVWYSDLPPLYNRAKVFVAPTYGYNGYIEQFAYTIGESLACEVPAITTDNGAIPEVYGECEGVKIVPQGDAEALRNAIIHLIKDEKLREKMGKEGRQWVEAHLSIKVIATKLIEVFEECLSN